LCYTVPNEYESRNKSRKRVFKTHCQAVYSNVYPYGSIYYFNKQEEKPMEDRKNEQKKQPDTLKPEENRASKPVELDPDQLDKVSGGTSSIPPEWFMKDE
jgi:hypothetical protein